MEPIIKTAFCVSYDWGYLRSSLPRIYHDSDIICLAIDKDRKAWSGKKYSFDEEEFKALIKSLDQDSKISVYEDNFVLDNLNSRENCNRHRTMIADYMGQGGWHLQVDADEYFLDFPSFAQQLKQINPNPDGGGKGVNICTPFIPLFKKTDNGYLYVEFGNKLPEMIPIATDKPHYMRARQNDHFNIFTNFYVVHESWARDEEQLWYKLNNWGHSTEELEEQKKRSEYFQFWKDIEESNYQGAVNLHPATPETWPALKFGRGQNIDEFINQLDIPEFPMSSSQLFIKNNRMLSRIIHLFNRVGL